MTQQSQAKSIEDFLGVWTDEAAEGSPIKGLLYGDPGSGKTFLAATFPGPVLFLDMEGGLKGLKNLPQEIQRPFRFPKDVNRKIETYAEFEEGVKIAKKLAGKQVKTVVCDSMNHMIKLKMAEILDEFDVDRVYQNQPTQQDYGKLGRDIIATVDDLFSLPCNVIFTAISTNAKWEDDKKIPSFLGNMILPEMIRLPDLIGYCHTQAIKTTDGAISQNVVSFTDGPRWLAKNRTSKTTVQNKAYPNNYLKIFSK